jgi:hypothetical protein
LEVALFVVEFAVVRGACEDLDPFVGEHAADGMEGFFSRLMVTHKGASPSRMFRRPTHESFAAGRFRPLRFPKIQKAQS